MSIRYQSYAMAGVAALAAVALAAVALLALAPSASAAQPEGSHGSVSFINVYAHNRLYGSVVAPNSLPAKGNFDELYVFPGTSFTIVSDAAPGDTNYNGGRWHVNIVLGAMEQFTNAEDVLASGLTIGSTNTYFSCPLLPQ
jgi:hypothetical protein